MALYAIGDIHGCWKTLKALLARIDFRPRRDRLWLVGDLVNRGPGSLKVLRWARRHEKRVTTVLGNHDLHLIGRALGVTAARSGDVLDKVLKAADGKELVDWLRRRPLLHRKGKKILVHAGLLPQWTVAEAESVAAELSEILAGDQAASLIAALRGRRFKTWSSKLSGIERHRTGLAAFTLLRTCTPNGAPHPGFSGSPKEAPAGHRPWFELASPRGSKWQIVAGHWAALGLHQAPGVALLDSGCAWGGHLTALRLDDMKLFQEALRDPVPRRKAVPKPRSRR